jgi:hypothetical protein
MPAAQCRQDRLIGVEGTVDTLHYSPGCFSRVMIPNVLSAAPNSSLLSSSSPRPERICFPGYPRRPHVEDPECIYQGSDLIV